MAKRFNKLDFEDINPYAEGEVREDWDPTTGTKRAKKKFGNTAPKKATPAAKQATCSNPKPAAIKQPKTSGYKGSTFDPNYLNRYRDRGKGSGSNYRP
jgi:hypothetical protein